MLLPDKTALHDSHRNDCPMSVDCNSLYAITEVEDPAKHMQGDDLQTGSTMHCTAIDLKNNASYISHNICWLSEAHLDVLRE